MGFRFLGVERNRTLVVVDGTWDVLDQVERVTQVVVNVCQLGVQIQGFLVEGHRVGRSLGVIVGVTKSYESLKFLVVYCQSLFVVPDGLISMSSLK